MEMRFDLFERSGTRGAWTLVDVDGFGEWDLSDPDVSGFVVKKRVSGLVAGYSYRALVHFRWRNDQGRIVKGKRVRTRACVQPSTAPDLRPQTMLIEAGPRPDVLIYRTLVRNRGRGTAQPFDVVLAVNAVAQPAQRTGPLAPGKAVWVAIQAPRCERGTIVRFSVDVRSEVAEAEEGNNDIERRCEPPT